MCCGGWSAPQRVRECAARKMCNPQVRTARSQSKGNAVAQCEHREVVKEAAAAISGLVGAALGWRPAAVCGMRFEDPVEWLVEISSSNLFRVEVDRSLHHCGHRWHAQVQQRGSNDAKSRSLAFLYADSCLWPLSTRMDSSAGSSVWLLTAKSRVRSPLCPFFCVMRASPAQPSPAQPNRRAAFC